MLAYPCLPCKLYVVIIFLFIFFIVRNALLEWTCNTKNLCNDCCHESACSLTNLLQKEFKKAGHLFKEWLEWLKRSKNIHQVAHNISKFHYCIIMLVHMKQGFFKFSPYITSHKFMLGRCFYLLFFLRKSLLRLKWLCCIVLYCIVFICHTITIITKKCQKKM